MRKTIILLASLILSLGAAAQSKSSAVAFFCVNPRVFCDMAFSIPPPASAANSP